ncbi:Crp/Fnr family transcriptional regulator [Oceanirhabdus sp. W0125-5]|uniref:Crp/Fnr family transcriptional regulator n=1 Tax=Oceanirhabdus sp. W0125-5 TaxID=2999116 RepID=UPI0022F31883|nr:Crp/Fnr family transcriptional regulator [Oceanirhabdus sp. W0125-5]WBW97324.1 Crp/Fnr family transcriptional regulator [Oceanirhabdus sp. W0125-5]
MMESIYKELESSQLFIGFNHEGIKELFKSVHYRTKNYSKNEIIAYEGDEIKELGIILSGEVYVEKVYVTGKVIKVKKLTKGELVGHASVFSDYNYYPCTIVAKNDLQILYIPQDKITDICLSSRQFLINFIRLISNQTVYLSNKLKFISYDTIRKKIVDYLLKEYKKQKTCKVIVSFSRKEMAEVFGVTRPALSNEMINMKNDGLIEYRDNIIEIKDLELLKIELGK